MPGLYFLCKLRVFDAQRFVVRKELLKLLSRAVIESLGTLGLRIFGLIHRPE